jgi:hypothetical protein
MNDEELLRGVANRAKEQENDPNLAVLDRLARGEKVSDAELAGIDPDVVAMFRPVNDAKIASRIAPPANDVRRVDFRKWAPVLAAAAAITLFFLWPRHRDDALPDYTFEISGNVAEVRAGDPHVVEAHAKLHKEATLEIVLRPQEKVASKIAVRTALVRDGKAQPWSPPVQISPEGAVRISGPVKTLFPDLNAPWDVLVGIGSEDALPSDATKLEAGKGYRLVRGTIEFTQ